MRAQNLTISVPNKGCNKKCPYCVSKMTGYLEENNSLFKANIDKVRTIAEAAQVASVLITGKGEPFINFDAVDLISRKFSKFPIEIQTNGIMLKKMYYEHSSAFSEVTDVGINVLAFSIDCVEYWKTLGDMFKELHKLGVVVRVTLNVTDEIGDISFKDILNIAESTNTRQLSLRNILIPERTCGTDESKRVIEWIRNNSKKENYKRLLDEFSNDYKDPYDVVRSLPFGAEVFDINGIAFTYFDSCVQESNNTQDIRSLIYQEDGHLYTSWDSPASILF